ncbi:hypothetical protein QE152_g41564, partial [Popillia japonica]
MRSGASISNSTVYSDTPDINAIPDGLDAFYLETDKLRKAEIVHKVPEATSQLQMRFMGQRYIPDSEILQELSVLKQISCVRRRLYIKCLRRTLSSRCGLWGSAIFPTPRSCRNRPIRMGDRFPLVLMYLLCSAQNG